jgi:hypothetical protein
MQYLLNQEEYDEYISLKTNKEPEQEQYSVAYAFEKSILQWRIERVFNPQRYGDDDYHMIAKAKDIPDDIKFIFDKMCNKTGLL